MMTGSHAQAASRKQNVMDGRSGFRLQAKQHIAGFRPDPRLKFDF
jgi:hypothetical protein